MSWENTQKETTKARAINYWSLRSEDKFKIFSRSEGDDMSKDGANILSYWNRMKPSFAWAEVKGFSRLRVVTK